jgi:hypothetical protein
MTMFAKANSLSFGDPAPETLAITIENTIIQVITTSCNPPIYLLA